MMVSGDAVIKAAAAVSSGAADATVAMLAEAFLCHRPGSEVRVRSPVVVIGGLITSTLLTPLSCHLYRGSTRSQ